MSIRLEASWLEVLHDEFDKDYMKNLKSFLVREQQIIGCTLPTVKSSQPFSIHRFTVSELSFSVKIHIMVQEKLMG